MDAGIAGSDFGNTRSRRYMDVPAAAARGTGPPLGAPDRSAGSERRIGAHRLECPPIEANSPDTRMRVIVSLVLSLFVALAAPGLHAEAKQAPRVPIIGYDARFHPVPSREGMVVSSEALASEVGARILAAGGNAIDAAVATGFALAVTYPQAGNIGGGGFMLVHLNKEDRKSVV